MLHFVSAGVTGDSEILRKDTDVLYRLYFLFPSVERHPRLRLGLLFWARFLVALVGTQVFPYHLYRVACPCFGYSR